MENGQAQADRLQRASKAPFFGAHNLIHGLKAGIPCWAWVSEGVAVLKTGKIYMSDGQEKARFPIAWRQKKTDLVLRTSIKGYSVTLALNHALSIWRIISRLRTLAITKIVNWSKTGRLCIVSRVQALLHRKQGDFAWHETCRQQLLCPFCALRGLPSMCERIGPRLPL